MATLNEIVDALNALKSQISQILLRIKDVTGYSTKHGEMTMIEMDENFVLAGDGQKGIIDNVLDLIDIIPDLVDVPPVDDETLQALIDVKEVTMTTDVELTYPDDSGVHIYKEDASPTELIIRENLTLSKLPNVIIVTTAPGAGNITLAAHQANVQTVQFKHKGVDVLHLPGNGHHTFGFLLKPGTSIYNITAIGAVPFSDTLEFAANPSVVYAGSTFYQIAATAPEDCTLYWGTYTEGSPAHDADDIKIGTGAINFGNTAMVQSTAKTYLVEGSLARLTDYDHYAFLETAGGGRSPVFKVDVTTTKILVQTSGSFSPSTNDSGSDPLQMQFNTSNMPPYSKLVAWCMADGGSGAAPFTSCTFSGTSMTKQFEMEFTTGTGAKRVMQKYVLPEASCPKGSFQITIGEGGTPSSGRVMGAYIIESTEQALKTLLTVTDSDSSRDDMRLTRGAGLDTSNLSLASLTGRFLAMSIFCTPGDEPYTSDGVVFETLSKGTSRGAQLSWKEGNNDLQGFTVGAATAGTIEHLVFAEYEKA